METLRVASLMPGLKTEVNLPKVTISFVIFVRPSVRARGTNLLSWNSIFVDFSKNLLRKFKFRQTLTKTTGNLYKDLRIFLKMSCWILFRMGKATDKICRDNQNTCSIFNIFFRQSRSLSFRRRIKSHLPFAGIIRSSPFSPRFQDKG